MSTDVTIVRCGGEVEETARRQVAAIVCCDCGKPDPNIEDAYYCAQCLAESSETDYIESGRTRDVFGAVACYLSHTPESE
jgi:NMD protein affecting ribosome stability and mRNA decay